MFIASLAIGVSANVSGGTVGPGGARRGRSARRAGRGRHVTCAAEQAERVRWAPSAASQSRRLVGPWLPSRSPACTRASRTVPATSFLRQLSCSCSPPATRVDARAAGGQLAHRSGTTPGSGQWMTVCGRSPEPPPPAGEPLLQSVRDFLAAPPPGHAAGAAAAGDVNNNARGMPSQAELLQRQPLLARAGKPAPPPATDDARAAPHDFIVDIPPPATRDERFPKEVWKTIVSFLFLFGCVCVNMASLSMVHDRLPDRNTTAPLPDIVLDNVAPRDWALAVSEYIIMCSTTTAMLVVLFHKHRFIVSRRLFFLIGLLYLYRSITMFVTVLPVSSSTYYCSPKSNDTTPLLILRRTFYLISGFGLSINGKHTYCGDYIYSGHTMVLVLSYLIVAEYSPRRLWALQWALWAAAALGVTCVLLAHGHYTVDVIIAYYVTTRLWWTAHALLAGASRGPLAREWWWRGLAWLEHNVRGPVPRRYDWPLPWPRTKLFARLS